jgi:hypothetical protein
MSLYQSHKDCLPRFGLESELSCFHHVKISNNRIGIFIISVQIKSVRQRSRTIGYLHNSIAAINLISRNNISGPFNISINSEGDLVYIDTRFPTQSSISRYVSMQSIKKFDRIATDSPDSDKIWSMLYLGCHLSTLRIGIEIIRKTEKSVISTMNNS